MDDHAPLSPSPTRGGAGEPAGPAVLVEHLSKDFDGLRAVDDVSFRIESGRIFGLLGPNGAGKSTTLAMLATLLPPTSGTARINGFEIAGDPDGVRRSIGIVFQDQSLDEELTARENMDFHGRLYHVPAAVRRQRIDELLALVGLAERQRSLVKTFSGGMRRRLEIARGLLHRPRVLFLDEPTLGLDPQTRNLLWGYIERLRDEQRITMILTTHYMEEADRLCDEVAVIDRGRIIAAGAPETLKEEVGEDTVTLATSDNEAVLERVRVLSAVRRAEISGDAIQVDLDRAEAHIAELVNCATAAGASISAVNVHTPTLEDVFLRLTGRTIREEEVGGRDRMRMARRMWRR